MEGTLHWSRGAVQGERSSDKCGELTWNLPFPITPALFMAAEVEEYGMKSGHQDCEEEEDGLRCFYVSRHATQSGSKLIPSQLCFAYDVNK